MQRCNKRAFTLIELLVVIAITAIMAAILFPVFAAAREQARMASCLSNMRQMALAVHMYAQDYDEQTPPNIDYVPDFANPDPATRMKADGPWRPNYLWCLQAYLKNQQIQACPSLGSAFDSGVEPTPFSRTSYMGNGAIMGASLAAVPAPAGVVFLQEWRWLGRVAWLRPGCDSPTNCWGWCWWAPDGKPGFSYHHMKGANFVYLDGHARYRKNTALRSGDFGLNPPGDAMETKGDRHSGVCGKYYTKQF
jgi:prepilin-type N-terminal cleavage/methylation domain-containing protein/prepilin-type processing-associated H-X9-DG protein